MYDTPFVLKKDKTNKYKVTDGIEKTVRIQSEIPFLRTTVKPSELSKISKLGFGLSTKTATNRERRQAKTLKRLSRKEIGWNGYVKPISQYNTKVHPSMRIEFEQI